MPKMKSLLEAVEDNDILEILRLVSTFCDLDFTHDELHRRTPLSVAITLNNLSVVRILLDHGASPNAPYDMFWTTPPLLAAARCDNNEIVELLLEYGARVDGTDKCGLNALVIACRRGNLPLCRLLLDRGARLQHVTDYEPLPECLDRLVCIAPSEEFYQRRSEPFRCNDALVEACRYRHPAIVQELLHRGADVSASRTANGNTPLHVASFCETQERYISDQDEPAKKEVMPTCPATVQVLINHGAHPNAINQFGETPIGCLMSHLARISCYRDRSKYVRENLEYYFLNMCLLVKAGCPLATKYLVDVNNHLRNPRRRWVKTIRLLTVAYNSQKSFDEQCGDTALDHAFVKAMEVSQLSGLRMKKEELASLYNTKLSMVCKHGVVERFFQHLILGTCCLPTLRQLCQQKIRQMIRPPLVKNVSSDDLGLPSYLRDCLLLEYDVRITVPNYTDNSGANLPDYWSNGWGNG